MIVNDADARFAVAVLFLLWPVCKSFEEDTSSSFLPFHQRLCGHQQQLSESGILGQMPLEHSFKGLISSLRGRCYLNKLYFSWCLREAWIFLSYCISKQEALWEFVYIWQGQERWEGKKESVAFSVVAYILKILFTCSVNTQLNLCIL